MELRKITAASIETALDKAKHYRLLNDPDNAESICRDVLATEPNNDQAIALLILALTDQFGEGSARIGEAKTLVPKLASEYDRSYYHGLVCERAAKSVLATHRPGSQDDAYDWLREAMDHFDRAQRAATDDRNDDPVLRWNACARLIEKHHLQPRASDSFRPYDD